MNNNEQPKIFHLCDNCNKEFQLKFEDHMNSKAWFGCPVCKHSNRLWLRIERPVSHPQEPQVKSAEEMKINSDRVKGLTYFINSVPMALLNEVFSKVFHGQTLQRLNERGGMGVTEILANIKHDKSIAFKSETQDDINELCEIVEKHNRIAASQFKSESTEELKEYKTVCEQYHNSNLSWQETCLQKTNKIIELQREIERLKSEPKAWTPPTDEQLNKIRDKYSAKWKENNIEYPENDYLSGVNDGIYHLRNWMRDQNMSWTPPTELQVKKAAKEFLEKGLDKNTKLEYQSQIEHDIQSWLSCSRWLLNQCLNSKGKDSNG